MPIYKMKGKKDGLQKYRVRINYTDREGKSRQLDRVAYGKEDAKSLERQLCRELETEPIKKITLQQLYDEYIKVKKHEVRETTLEKSKQMLSGYVLPALKNYKLEKINMKVLQDWKTKIEEHTTNDGKALSIGYKKKIFATFKAMFNYAVKMKYMPENLLITLGNFKDPYATKKEIEFYTADEFLKFKKVSYQLALDDEQQTGSISEWNFYMFFNIAFYTGMRKGEIYALKWSDIRNDTIYISRSITQKLKGEDRETPPKNDRSYRSIKIPVPLKKVLNEHYARYKQISGFNDDWRICGGIRCIRDTTLSNRNKKYAEAAELKKIRIHDFRHSHASLLAFARVNIQEISRRLGHANIEITWNTYSHLYPKEKEIALDVLNKVA